MFSGALESVPQLVELIEHQNEEILVLADRATPDISLYGHSVNVCIFSLLLGHTMGWGREQLVNLGFCAFLHDIGTAGNQGASTAPKKEKPPETENAAARRLPGQGQQTVREMAELTEDIKTMVLQVMVQLFEKKNSAEGPALKGSDIHEFGRLIAVADVYESLTHPRPNRERLIPHEALKMMISTAEQDSNADIIKAFIERLSLYPPASYVRLNTDEIARVIGINTGLPTRPKVRIIIDGSLQKAAEPKTIDLSVTPMIFIKDALDETKLSLPDKRLSLELKAVRWWVKGL
ncbi:MAG: HD-GYP domain-containing protein [Endomicrobiales bacterium]